MLKGLNIFLWSCERTLQEASRNLSTISLLLFPCLYILVASSLTVELFWLSAGCLELLESRITKWTCNAQGLLNLKLSLSTDAWQKLMVQRGSSKVPADVCKCCHQCMHTPHASSHSLSWINPKAWKSLHAPVRLLHAPKRFAPSEMIWLEAWFEGISHSDWTELQTASLMKLMKEQAFRYYEAVCMKQKLWFNIWKCHFLFLS